MNRTRYTLPRAGTANSRFRDLVDMVLLIQSRTLDVFLAAKALQRTFDCRGTHPIPAALEPPPPNWNTPFDRAQDGFGHRAARVH
ncbi:nucleotidyl transferase AbiEii/AbiGii toxin family protein [Silvibacterium dinghuense]|uniref:nucleotidyl transferase AbiEii/AbiGii toxin family protein n=1 Tax=Silvibacterium dinghuense TaxID=1560006 RepID=UPI0035716D78